MLMDFLAVTVLREAGFEAFDNIAGGETAGIPFAALVAERLALPMTYVRKKPKGYGRNARIEGAMTEGQRVLLVEDLTTDGGSKLSLRRRDPRHRRHLRPYGGDLLLRHLRGNRGAAGRAWRQAASISAPGGTCWPRRAPAAPSMPRRWRGSRTSCATRAPGSRPAASDATSRRICGGGAVPCPPRDSGWRLPSAAPRDVVGCSPDESGAGAGPQACPQSYQSCPTGRKACIRRAGKRGMRHERDRHVAAGAGSGSGTRNRRAAAQHRGRAAASGRGAGQQRHLRPHRQRW
jgi:hypothetical protein